MKLAVIKTAKGRTRTFKEVEDVELHVAAGQHTESVYDRLIRDYAVKFSPLTIEGEISTSNETESSTRSSSFFSNLSQVGFLTSQMEETVLLNKTNKTRSSTKHG